MSNDPPQLNRPRGRGRQQTVPVVEPHVAPLRRPTESVNILKKIPKKKSNFSFFF